MSALIEVEALTIGIARPDGGRARLVEEVTFSVGEGESLGIAGESGCGKSTVLLAMMGLLKPGLERSGGAVRFGGLDMLASGDDVLEQVRGRQIALVPQNAATAMTPSITVGAQIAEALMLHTGLSAADRQRRVVDLLRQARLPEPEALASRYPHQLSGGQVQRAAIAMALACGPKALLLDEPTTGLDVTTQAGILDLLAALRRETGVAMACVSHDLGVLAALCDRLAVMYAGRIVEEGPTPAVLGAPRHRYAAALVASVPRLDPPGLPRSIPGRPPAPGEAGAACAFAPRCEAAQDRCHAVAPPLEPAGEGRRAACWFPATGGSARPATGGDQPETAEGDPVLGLEDVSIAYGKRPLLRWRAAPAPAVTGVTMALMRGEIVGLVGESGSGKSTILRAIAGLWPVQSGVIVRPGATDGIETADSRRLVQLVFQNPDASLNPRHTVEEILAQPLRLYFGLGRDAIRVEAERLLADVRLDTRCLARYPAQLSGGERQRVAIARAFAAKPDVLLCDEVTSALDVSVQASVLRLIRDLSRERGVATLMVSHDLAVVRALCHRIAVLYRGRIVEEGPAAEVTAAPLHPYTRALLAAAGPRHRHAASPARDADDAASSGCPFAGRCPVRVARCLDAMPDWSAASGHRARCHLL